MTEKPSLRAYLKRYAQGGIPREEMLSTVAAWDYEEDDFDPEHIEPTHQDNTFKVLSGAALLGDITDDDYEEIHRRRRLRSA
ncbi:hypothetical protein OOK31_14055 [Streptomyces sp. NBC_00249]|uniref:hypothetical protein n=1 Tax=Streptomyces sp. NBC_00249 TaxID=2975690 RepID=UPI002253F5C3|nr:hypothetical protein [Streptomyces sp. NBC_00249]MCX5195014.1 hypothetical protein [Streptomyces sp. NBC_00249]